MALCRVGDVLILNILGGVALVAAGVEPGVVEHGVENDRVETLDGGVIEQAVVEFARPAGECSVVDARFEAGPHRELACFPTSQARAAAADTALHGDSAVDLKAVVGKRVDDLHRHDALGAVLRLVDINATIAEPVVFVHDQDEAGDSPAGRPEWYWRRVRRSCPCRSGRPRPGSIW